MINILERGDNMCKLFTITNMDKVMITPKLINTIRDAVCKISDKDGFGYAVVNEMGDLSGEKTTKPFNFTPLWYPHTAPITRALPIVENTIHQFGRVAQKGNKSLIAHGRLSTNDVNLSNTHPFTSQDYALIHNGVVSDASGELKDSLLTTCDTEILFQHFARGGMPDVESKVSGYYAYMVLDSAGYLHVARDDRAMLYITYSRTIHSFLIATTHDIIESICKEMKWKHEPIESVLENVYFVMDKNTIIQSQDIKPISNYALSSLANKALGSAYDYEDEYGSDAWGKSRYYKPNSDDAPSSVKYIDLIKEDKKYGNE